MVKENISKIILDEIQYGKENIERKIMNISFGEVHYLQSLITKIIHECKLMGKSDEDISTLIKTNVWGIEPDEKKYEKAIERIKTLLALYELKIDLRDNLICDDIDLQKFKGKFDYVIGNFLQDNQNNSYIHLFKTGLEMLNDKGKLCCLTSVSFMKNICCKNCKDYIVNKDYLSSFYEYYDSSAIGMNRYKCICLLDKNKNRVNHKIIFKRLTTDFNVLKKTEYTQEKLKELLKEKCWNLKSDEEISFIEENNAKVIKLGHTIKFFHGLQTKDNAIFIGDVFTDKECTISCNDLLPKFVYFKNGKNEVNKIESKILKKCQVDSDKKFLIFPYKMNSNKLMNSDNERIPYNYKPITIKKLEREFPFAYKYISSYYTKLTYLVSDEKWFIPFTNYNFKNTYCKKIIIKYERGKCKIQIIDEDVIVCNSSYFALHYESNDFIHPLYNKKGKKQSNQYRLDSEGYNKKFNELVKILSSERFAKYYDIVGERTPDKNVILYEKMLKNYGLDCKTYNGIQIVPDDEEYTTYDITKINKRLNDLSLKEITKSYYNIAKNGKTSSKKVSPLHGLIAKIIQFKLGTEFDIMSNGYGEEKEYHLEKNNLSKDLDIAVFYNDDLKIQIEFKLATNNFKQNYKNYLSTLSEQCGLMENLQTKSIFVYFFPYKHLYLNDKKELTRFDIMTQKDLINTREIIQKVREKGNEVCFVIYDPFKNGYLDSLITNTKINTSDKDFLSNIETKAAKLDFVDDEEIKLFFKKQNVAETLDNFLCSLIHT